MDEQFIFEIERNEYYSGASINNEFINQYGNWHVRVGRIHHSFKFLLHFNANFHLPDDALKSLKINVKFKDIQTPSYSFTKMAIHCTNSSLYEFYASSFGLPDPHYFSVTVEVDASSIFDWFAPDDTDHFLTSFTGKAFDEGTLADITIKTPNGQKIKANKFILSRSPVFDAMLNKHDTKEAQQSIIEVTDIKHEVMTEMVRYMYTDEIPKMKELALDLIIAANKYMLPGLIDETERYLRHNITIHNFEEISIIAGNLNLVKLQASIVKFVVDNYGSIFATDEWKSFKEKNLQFGATEVLEKCIGVMKYSTN